MVCVWNTTSVPVLKVGLLMIVPFPCVIHRVSTVETVLLPMYAHAREDGQVIAVTKTSMSVRLNLATMVRHAKSPGATLPYL